MPERRLQQTYYDTLKVSRDAPLEVIRAAYRVLSQKYHPDRRPADRAAAETMGLLNRAYEVLSDPDRRQAHDAWIRRTEAEPPPVRPFDAAAQQPAGDYPEQETNSDAGPAHPLARHLRRWGILYGGSALLAASVVVVLSVAQRPQMSPWVAAPPAPEDREASIRQMAREVMLRQGDAAKSADVPSGPGTPTSASGDSPPPGTVHEAAATPAEPRLLDDAPPASDGAPPVVPSMEDAGSTLDLPFGSTDGPEHPSFAESYPDAGAPATSVSVPPRAGGEAAGGTE